MQDNTYSVQIFYQQWSLVELRLIIFNTKAVKKHDSQHL